MSADVTLVHRFTPGARSTSARVPLAVRPRTARADYRAQRRIYRHPQHVARALTIATWCADTSELADVVDALGVVA